MVSQTKHPETKLLKITGLFGKLWSRWEVLGTILGTILSSLNLVVGSCHANNFMLWSFSLRRGIRLCMEHFSKETHSYQLPLSSPRSRWQPLKGNSSQQRSKAPDELPTSATGYPVDRDDKSPESGVVKVCGIKLWAWYFLSSMVSIFFQVYWHLSKFRMKISLLVCAPEQSKTNKQTNRTPNMKYSCNRNKKKIKIKMESTQEYFKARAF